MQPRRAILPRKFAIASPLQAWSARLSFALIGAALSAMTPAFAQQDEDAPKSIPAELQAAVTRSEFLGRQLYLHDRAAWLATDAMLADTRARALMPKMGGWLTEPSAHGVRVVFFSNEDTPRRLYEIDVDERERLTEPVLESSEPMSADLLAQRKARELVLSQSFMTCAQRYNTAILPSSEGLRVYLMPGFVKTGVYPVGGYHVFETDKRGERIVSSRKFSNGCLDLDENAAQKDRSAKAVALMATHLLDPQPTEVHVFVSLHAKLPLSILTVDNRAIWSVAKGRIDYGGELEKK